MIFIKKMVNTQHKRRKEPYKHELNYGYIQTQENLTSDRNENRAYDI